MHNHTRHINFLNVWPTFFSVYCRVLLFHRQTREEVLKLFVCMVIKVIMIHGDTCKL